MKSLYRTQQNGQFQGYQYPSWRGLPITTKQRNCIISLFYSKGLRVESIPDDLESWTRGEASSYISWLVRFRKPRKVNYRKEAYYDYISKTA